METYLAINPQTQNGVKGEPEFTVNGEPSFFFSEPYFQDYLNSGLQFVYDPSGGNTCVLVGQEDTEWMGICEAGKMDDGCIEKILCENKKLAGELLELQNRENGSHQMLFDTTSVYNNNLLKFLNVSVANVGLCFGIFKLLIAKSVSVAPVSA
jgi:hypothetical protein